MSTRDWWGLAAVILWWAVAAGAVYLAGAWRGYSRGSEDGRWYERQRWRRAWPFSPDASINSVRVEQPRPKEQAWH